VRVLVVDDHPLIRDTLRQVLKELDDNIELLVAASAGKALAVAAEHNPIELALLDLELTGASALGLLRALRERFPAVPVVVISALEHADIIIQTLIWAPWGSSRKRPRPRC